MIDNQQQAIDAMKNADITKWDWDTEIIEDIRNRFASGYLRATAERLSDTFGSSEEEFREEMTKACEADIWK